MRAKVRKNKYKNPLDEPPRSLFMKIADIVFKSLCSVAFIGGMSLMFIFGHDALTQCDYFKAQHVIIRGDSRLTPEQIMDVARIKTGTNILSVSLPGIRKRLMAVPWISDVEVYRELPGSIIIFIKEHKAVAVIDLGRPFLINQNGDIFKEAVGEEAAGFPVITGVDCADWRSSQMPQTQVFAAVMEILNMGGHEGEVLTNKMIKTIQVDREMGLSLLIDAPVALIKLGYGDYRKKYERLDRIFAYIRQHDHVPAIAALDLRVVDHVAACLNTDQGSEGEKKEVKGGKA
ncbi:MAG: FtsQ-type POTRA domain-containing protein [Desulfobacterales bacterium]|jgi:cell division protein FtsQ|nr:FtsQ-type POTRA domain-containing protein [Desulfobacterales bacterium]